MNILLEPAALGIMAMIGSLLILGFIAAMIKLTYEALHPKPIVITPYMKSLLLMKIASDHKRNCNV